MIKRVKIQLMTLLICIGALPVILSFILVHYMIDYQTGISNQIGFDSILEEYTQDLKKVAEYDLENEEVYRKKFENVQDLRIVVESNDGVLSRVKDSLFRFYLLFFGAFFLILFFIGSYISKLISSRYSEAYLELQAKTEKEKYLSQFEKISEITKKLNHEMKKPLGPIEIWNQNLRQSFQSNDENKEEVLEQASQIISEEVATLRSLVNSFNDFSSLPEPQLRVTSVVDFFEWTFSKFKEVYPKAIITLDLNVTKSVRVNIDESALSLVFQNLIENALEANPNTKVSIEIDCSLNKKSIEIDFRNWGRPLGPNENLFENFVSSSLETGKGLGLSIVKVSMLKHGGDVKVLPFEEGAFFKLRLPVHEEQ